MQHTEGHLAGADGLNLYYQRWASSKMPRAVLAMVHGVGEHSGRYINLVRPLVEAGYTVCGYDQRGHGNSQGPRVHIKRWAQYREDLSLFLDMIQEQAPERPLVVYGHSMGSLVVLGYLLEVSQEFRGAIISGVPLAPAGVGSAFKVIMARALSGIAPRSPVDLGIEASSLTRDPVAQEAFQSDPKVVGRATARWTTEILDTIERIKENMEQVALPTLVLHGQDDPLNMVDGAHALFAAISHPDKSLRTYPSVLHEPHNDLNHALVASDVQAWLSRLISS